MDFFEAQERARKRTTRLVVVLFGLAVLGTIAFSYLAVMGAAQCLSRATPPVTIRPRRSSSGSILRSWPRWPPARWTVVGFASLYKWSQFRTGGSTVAEGVGGRRLDPNTTDLHERRLLNVVEEMAIASGVPVPAVYVLDTEPGLNAFAAELMSERCRRDGHAGHDGET